MKAVVFACEDQARRPVATLRCPFEIVSRASERARSVIRVLPRAVIVNSQVVDAIERMIERVRTRAGHCRHRLAHSPLGSLGVFGMEHLTPLHIERLPAGPNQVARDHAAGDHRQGCARGA